MYVELEENSLKYKMYNLNSYSEFSRLLFAKLKRVFSTKF